MPLQAGNGSAPVYVVTLDITGGASDANVFESLANPAGVNLIVHRAYLITSVVATAAATLDIGIHASSASTGADNLLDGIDVNAATGTFDSADGTDNGSNGVAKPQAWAAAGYINVEEKTGNVNGLVGKLYVEYTYA